MVAAFVYVCNRRNKIRTHIVNDEKEMIAVQPPPPPLSNAVVAADPPTMDRFFQELAQDKPVRFTVEQVCTFTSNYTKVLGSGGFGKVYEGKFPDGVKIAVNYGKCGEAVYG